MARATEAEVKQINRETTWTEEQITAYLELANNKVTDIYSVDDYSTTTLRQIEAVLAAHFVALADPEVTEEKIDDLRVKYGGPLGPGLQQTRYGQILLLIDHKGIIAGVGSMGEAKIEAIDIS